MEPGYSSQVLRIAAKEQCAGNLLLTQLLVLKQSVCNTSIFEGQITSVGRDGGDSAKVAVRPNPDITDFFLQTIFSL